MDSVTVILFVIEYIFIFIVFLCIPDKYNDKKLRLQIEYNKMRINELEEKIKKLEDRTLVTELNSAL